VNVILKEVGGPSWWEKLAVLFWYQVHSRRCRVRPDTGILVPNNVGGPQSTYAQIVCTCMPKYAQHTTWTMIVSLRDFALSNRTVPRCVCGSQVSGLESIGKKNIVGQPRKYTKSNEPLLMSHFPFTFRNPVASLVIKHYRTKRHDNLKNATGTFTTRIPKRLDDANGHKRTIVQHQQCFWASISDVDHRDDRFQFAEVNPKAQ
jgi:hypothetical protein